ncbi:transglycosylase SLT domain-containing protein [Catonella massiliensis]|uniref:Transglycosylase SLT domain-containing protein n=1 Tax=Catonella massiliensis TaxID=2799636 RepID=A0ABS1J3C2_9FIRM|nr:transglycosylase SLT domain-containing protein [Catonella massiliensis]MBK5898636.1 transglycosylase SLT domain-containing protein [Catonella massiliensis]
MNLRVIALLIILSLTIRGKPIEESIQAVKISPVMPDKAKQAKVKRAKPKKAKLKAADKKAVDFMNSSLGEWIIEYSASKGIDPFLILAIAERESGLNPNAVGDNGASIGLMQIQPRWSWGRMKMLGVDDLREPRGCVKVAIDILLEYKEKDSDLYFVLMACNGGVAYAKRNINTPSDYALKVSERAAELSRLYEVAE